MVERVKTIHELEIYRSQPFPSQEAQYEGFESIFTYIIQKGDAETINDFILLESKPFILSHDYNMKLLQYLMNQEPYFKDNLKECLAVLYLVIGHCYYFSLDFEKAKNYYKIASSYALQFENYSVLSIAMNNYTAAQKEVLPSDVLWQLSKLPAVFFKMGSEYDERYFITRFIAHIEISLQLNKVQYAESLYNSYFTGYEVEKDSRIDLHIRVLRGKIHYQKGEYETAIELLHEVLIVCMNLKRNKDLVQECYTFITDSYKMLNEDSISREMEQFHALFYRKIETDKRYMEKYIKAAYDNEYEQDEHFLSPLSRFKLAGKCLLSNVENDGHTLVLVDCKILTCEEESISEILYLINDEMMKAMKQEIITSTRIDASTIGYIIQLSEQETDELCAKVFAKIREQYPRNGSVLEAIYFASVNNKENNLANYQKCLDLAYAYIYYELYK
ncbi:dehydrogenase [Solibacillus sp. FSL K6-4121]|uniref:dehydrogenase n=1 Tax=Solibacillus sp. FSL K6-4121 TaxID=2921505 RepID=UPI0030FA81B6